MYDNRLVVERFQQPNWMVSLTFILLRFPDARTTIPIANDSKLQCTKKALPVCWPFRKHEGCQQQVTSWCTPSSLLLRAVWCGTPKLKPWKKSALILAKSVRIQCCINFQHQLCDLQCIAEPCWTCIVSILKVQEDPDKEQHECTNEIRLLIAFCALIQGLVGAFPRRSHFCLVLGLFSELALAPPHNTQVKPIHELLKLPQKRQMKYPTKYPNQSAIKVLPVFICFYDHLKF